MLTQIENILISHFNNMFEFNVSEDICLWNETYSPIDFSNGEKVMFLMEWFIIQVFGNALLLGLIEFDRFGGDPLKRRIIDQVCIWNLESELELISISYFQIYAIGCIISIFNNLTLLNIEAIFVLSSTELNDFCRFWYKFIMITGSVFFSMSVSEAAILRFFTLFIWRRVPPIDHQFTCTFLTLFNTVFSILLGGFSRRYTLEDVALDHRFLGTDSNMKPISRFILTIR